MPEIAITFALEILEDLHAGTGVGRLGLVDDTQARDQTGSPVVWAAAVRGHAVIRVATRVLDPVVLHGVLGRGECRHRVAQPVERERALLPPGRTASSRRWPCR